MEQPKFYIQKINKKGEVLEEPKDIETEFNGLRYRSAIGINEMGEPRVYSEKYAESDVLRTHVPDKITRDATTITLKLIFIGENRQDTYYQFNDYICNGYHRYWDTARNRTFDFFVKEAIKPDKDRVQGQMSYIDVAYKLQNLRGQTKNINEEIPQKTKKK